MLPYLLIGTLLWIAMLKSGVHATLAGVLLAFTIPMKPKYDPQRLLSLIHDSSEQIKSAFKQNENIIVNDALRARVRALGEGIFKVQAPAQTLEHKLHLPSAYLIIPIFALANAGVPIEWSEIGSVMTHPVALGIGAGLVLGKLIGIAGFTWVAVKIGVTELPKALTLTTLSASLHGRYRFYHVDLYRRTGLRAAS